MDIKQSTYKNVKTFLKACAKEGLLKLKETKGDIQVTGGYIRFQILGRAYRVFPPQPYIPNTLQ